MFSHNTVKRIANFLALVLMLFVAACSDNSSTGSQVIVYTSVDQNYAEPILEAFSSKTGIVVKAIYDVEAAKTSGLVKRLIAESTNPQADVFWNGEPLQTMVLEKNSVLAQHRPNGLRSGHRQNTNAYWTAFGGRARVLIINKSRLTSSQWPKSLFDLGAGAWPGQRIAFAYPLFGTSATHAAALYGVLGQDRARRFYDRLLKIKVRFVDGNAAVRDLVVDGEADIGLTDTDDACAATRNGSNHLAVVFPDQGANDLGTLVIPNTVSLIDGGPNPEAGKKFIDYLLSKSVADKLAKAGWFHIDGTRVIAPKECALPSTIKPMNIDFEMLVDNMSVVLRDLRDRIIR